MQYDIAQICENGHVINTYYKSVPENNKQFCTKCGQKTMTHCEQCNSSIRGSRVTSSARTFSIPDAHTFNPPSYCASCGKAFPWTEGKITAAKELIDGSEIEQQEKEDLKMLIKDLIAETPKSQVAAIKYNKLVQRLSSDETEGLRDIIYDILCETAKQYI